MEFLEVEILESDIELSKYARALALPIRISIIRILLNAADEVNQDAFESYSLSPVVLGRHLYELKMLGILNSKYIHRKVYYSINKDVFKKMAIDFNVFFDYNKK